MIHNLSFASIHDRDKHELGAKVARDAVNYLLEICSIDTEGNLKVLRHFISSFRHLAFTSLGCGRPLYEVVFTPMNFSRSS